MRYCSSCRVTVTGVRARCPLCQNLLTGDIAPETEVFPRLPLRATAASCCISWSIWRRSCRWWSAWQ